MVLGEGAAMLVLESGEHASARGVNGYAELAGFGMSADATHITRPDIRGITTALRAALSDSGVSPDEVQYINAHGTGTEVNDVAETEAIHQVFGKHAYSLAISSTKSMHGHSLGAASAMELVATVLSLKYGLIPPTANFTGAGESCDLDYVPNQSRIGHVNFALSSSFAFGGLNAVLGVRQIM
jgi:nodulation protein E